MWYTLTRFSPEMEADDRGGGRLCFGVFELDLRAGELRKRGLRIRLQQQPFQVLALLLERAGQVVGREELQKALWPADTFVDFDHGLNKAINKIREALGDSAESPAVRRDRGPPRLPLHRRCESRRHGVGRQPQSRDSHSRSNGQSTRNGRSPSSERSGEDRHFHTGVACVGDCGLLMLVLLGLAAWRFSRAGHSGTVIRSLAVLPLENLSNDASQEYFADGMTDELISDLGQISALRVISRTSMMAYKHTRKSLPEIARELNVDAVVEGTVLHSGDEVRITAQLIEGAADRHLWSKSYQGELRNTLALQNTVAKAIADQIRISVNPQEQAALASVRVVNPVAYEVVSEGQVFLEQANGGKSESCAGVFQPGRRRGSEIRACLRRAGRHVRAPGRLAVCGHDAEGRAAESQSGGDEGTGAGRLARRGPHIACVLPRRLRLEPGRGWQGIPARRGIEPGVRDSAPLVRMAPGSFPSLHGSDRGNEKSGELRPPVSGDQR